MVRLASSRRRLLVLLVLVVLFPGVVCAPDAPLSATGTRAPRPAGTVPAEATDGAPSPVESPAKRIQVAGTTTAALESGDTAAALSRFPLPSGRPASRVLADIPGVSADSTALSGGIPGLEGALAARVFRKAVRSRGDPRRVEAAVARARRGEEVRVLALGSSVASVRGGCTEPLPVMAEACPDCCGAFYDTGVREGGWLLGLRRGLAAAAAAAGGGAQVETRVRIQNMGRPALELSRLLQCPSCWFRDFAQVDLFVLEFGVTLAPEWANLLEALVRWLLQQPRAPAVLLVNFFEFCVRGDQIAMGNHDWDGWTSCRPDGADKTKVPMTMTTPAGNTSLPARRQHALEVLAAHYRLPVISLRAAVYDEVAAGRIPLEVLTEDGTHPTAAGAALMATLLQHYLVSGADEARAGGGGGGGRVEPPPGARAGAADVAPPREGLPAPLYPTALHVAEFTARYGFEMEWWDLGLAYRRHRRWKPGMTDAWMRDQQSKGSTMGPNNRGQRWPTLPTREGWAYAEWDGRENTHFLAQTPAMQANRSEAVLVLEVDTRPVTAQQAQQQPFVQLSYLTSSERGGRVRVSCESSSTGAGPACSCGELVVDAHEPGAREEAVAEAELAVEGSSKACRVRLEILPASSALPPDRTFKLFAAAVGFSDRHASPAPPAAAAPAAAAPPPAASPTTANLPPPTATDTTTADPPPPATTAPTTANPPPPPTAGGTAAARPAHAAAGGPTAAGTPSTDSGPDRDLTPDLTTTQIEQYHQHVSSSARGRRFGIV